MSIIPSGSANEPSAELVSPGLAAKALGAAYELKFHLSLAESALVEAWARKHLQPDSHGNHGAYRVTSIYCDTPNFDVYHRTPGFKNRKFRVRRYGETDLVFLERKTKQGDRVRKKRVLVAPTELARLWDMQPDPAWQACWFHKRILKRSLRPTACVTYERTAFMGWSGAQPIRVTLDRNLQGVRADDWHFSPHPTFQPILADSVLVELKYHITMPSLLREMLSFLPAQPAKVSKYRHCAHVCGLVGAPALPDELRNQAS